MNSCLALSHKRVILDHDTMPPHKSDGRWPAHSSGLALSIHASAFVVDRYAPWSLWPRPRTCSSAPKMCSLEPRTPPRGPGHKHPASFHLAPLALYLDLDERDNISGWCW